MLLAINHSTYILFCIVFFGLALLILVGAGMYYLPSKKQEKHIGGNSPFLVVGGGLVFAFVAALFFCIMANTDFNEQEAYASKGKNVHVFKSDQDGIKDGVLTHAIFQVSESGEKVRFACGNLGVRMRDTAFFITKTQYDVIGIKEDFKDLLMTKEAGAVEGGNAKWRILTTTEWEYIINHNPSVWATVCGVNGLVIVPQSADISLDSTNIDRKTWQGMQMQGAVFLPAAGRYLIHKAIADKDSKGYYFLKSMGGRSIWNAVFSADEVITEELGNSTFVSVRLVTDY